MVQLALMGSETSLDIAKAFSMRELGKRHDQILIEATELFYIVIALIPRNASTKCVQWQVSHDLRENKLACIHDDPPFLDFEAEQSDMRNYNSSR